MHITINGQMIEVFDGARVMDAVRRYSRSVWKEVQADKKKVTDAHGHEIALDGELGDGDVLAIIDIPPSSERP